MSFADFLNAFAGSGIVIIKTDRPITKDEKEVLIAYADAAKGCFARETRRPEIQMFRTEPRLLKEAEYTENSNVNVGGQNEQYETNYQRTSIRECNRI